MNADNFWIIRKDSHGFFVPVMGFLSDESNPIINSYNLRFNTLDDALASISNEGTGYGTFIHSECYSDEPTELIANESGHYTGCPKDWDFLNEKAKCYCKEITEDWVKLVEPK